MNNKNKLFQFLMKNYRIFKKDINKLNYVKIFIK